MNTTAILLMNLGSPASPETKDLKPYLSEFLMDERVIDVPYLLRSILVKGIIVPFRASKSAAKYKTVWTKEGSPLVAHTVKLTQKVRERFPEPVYYCMRYGSPATADVLKKMHEENPGLNKIIFLPLYPHYAMSSYETGVVQVEEMHKAAGYTSSLNIIPPFYNNRSYISALSNAIEPFLEKEYDHILFSYHGIPERHVKKTDCTGMHCLKTENCCSVHSAAHAFCYRHQVITTTELVTDKLKIDKNKYSFSFQSRLGRDAWLKPFTTKQLEHFPKLGIKKLLIVCPAFVSDCLETLEEIEKEGAEDFIKAGGERLTMIPALNENTDWIDCLEELIKKEMQVSETRTPVSSDS